MFFVFFPTMPFEEDLKLPTIHIIVMEAWLHSHLPFQAPP